MRFNIMAKTECKTSLFPGGVSTVFQGRTKEYCIETYSTTNGHSFTDMSEYSGLIDTVTDLYLSIYPNRDRNISIERMKKSLSYPRTIVMLARYEEQSVGFGIFPRMLITGEPVLYSTRAFQKEHEREHMGSHTLSKAIRIHQEESQKGHRVMRYGVLMTQNAYSVTSLARIPCIDRVLPFKGERYSKYPQAKYYMLRVHSEVMLNSRTIETDTGVSRGELSELGMNEVRPDRSEEAAWAIHQEMVLPYPEGLNMNREGGDVVYVTFEINRCNIDLPVKPAA